MPACRVGEKNPTVVSSVNDTRVLAFIQASVYRKAQGIPTQGMKPAPSSCYYLLLQRKHHRLRVHVSFWCLELAPLNMQSSSWAGSTSELKDCPAARSPEPLLLGMPSNDNLEPWHTSSGGEDKCRWHLEGEFTRRLQYERLYFMCLTGDCKLLINALQAINPFHAPSLTSHHFRT